MFENIIRKWFVLKKKNRIFYKKEEQTSRFSPPLTRLEKAKKIKRGKCSCQMRSTKRCGSLI